MANGKLQYRAATLEDVPRLATLINMAFRSDTTTQVFLTSTRIDVTSVKDVTARLAIPNSAVLVATAENGELVGTVGVRKLDDRRAWLGMLAVDPSHHNSGLGRQVLAYAEDYSRQRWGINRMELDAVGTRKELIEWYERRGYQRTGEATPFPYGEGRDTSILRDDLDFKILGKDLHATAIVAINE